MNLPNLLTLSRIPMPFVIVALIYLSEDEEVVGCATIALLVFILSGVTDWLDGYLARKMNQVSNFGKLMDALTDKIMVVGIYIVLLANDILPWWTIIFLLLIISREFLITGIRSVAATTGVVIAADRLGKYKTVFQIVSISLLLAVPVIKNDLPVWTSSQQLELGRMLYFFEVTGIGTFVIASLITIISGANYLMKYWSTLFPESDSRSGG